MHMDIGQIVGGSILLITFIALYIMHRKDKSHD